MANSTYKTVLDGTIFARPYFTFVPKSRRAFFAASFWRLVSVEMSPEVNFELIFTLEFGWTLNTLHSIRIYWMLFQHVLKSLVHFCYFFIAFTTCKIY